MELGLDVSLQILDLPQTACVRHKGHYQMNLLCMTNTGRPFLRLSFLIHRVGITTFPSKTVILEEMMYVKVLSPKQALWRRP